MLKNKDNKVYILTQTDLDDLNKIILDQSIINNKILTLFKQFRNVGDSFMTDIIHLENLITKQGSTKIKVTKNE